MLVTDVCHEAVRRNLGDVTYDSAFSYQVSLRNFGLLSESSPQYRHRVQRAKGAPCVATGSSLSKRPKFRNKTW